MLLTGEDHLGAVVLLAGVAVVALAEAALARVALRANADAVADLDVLHLVAHADRNADDLVPDGQRVRRLAPAAAENVQVAAAHAAVRDADVDVRLLPGLGLELLPLHVTVGRRGVQALPSLELVVLRGHVVGGVVVGVCEGSKGSSILRMALGIRGLSDSSSPGLLSTFSGYSSLATWSLYRPDHTGTPRAVKRPRLANHQPLSSLRLRPNLENIPPAPW